MLRKILPAPILVIVSAVILSACSSDPGRYTKAEINEEILENTPNWILGSKAPDAKGIYSIGIGVADQLQLAIAKSRLRAEFGLAQVINREISGSEKTLTFSAGQETTDEEYRALINKLVKAVPLDAYEVVNKEVSVGRDGSYSAYIQLRMNHNDVQRIKSDMKRLQKHHESTDSSGIFQESFDSLQSEIDAQLR